MSISTKRTVPTKKPLPPKPSVEVAPLEPEDENPEVEDVDGGEEQDSNPAEEQTRVPRKKPTITDHIGHYDQLFSLLDAEIDRKSREKEKGTRTLRTVRKMLTQMRKEVPQVTRSKEARKQSSTRKATTSGLMMTFAISQELADFLKLPKDTRLSRIEVTRAICVYAHLKDDEKREEMLRWKYLNPGGKRNLQFPQDKKAIIPDKALAKLLGYDEYKRKVEAGLITHKTMNKETGKKEVVKVKTAALYYWAIQNLLNVHFLREETDEEETREEEEEMEDHGE